jgi:hypothetical protein
VSVVDFIETIFLTDHSDPRLGSGPYQYLYTLMAATTPKELDVSTTGNGLAAERWFPAMSQFNQWYVLFAGIKRA